jgi:vanillate O-demethylase monooxygenase subunit
MTYVKNCWYVAAWSPDLPQGAPFAITILEEPLVLFMTADGAIAALQDRCCHRSAPLSLGRVEDGCTLRCMYHGLKFDAGGLCIEIPGQEKIPSTARVRSFPAVERHSWIWIWMGNPELADEALIPPAVGLDHPDFILGHGQLDYEAEARLINDNLLDFSHLSYVHANSFGASEDWATSRPRITMLERGVRFERWLTVEPGRDTTIMSTEPIDRFSTYDFLLPGVLLMTGGEYPPGTAERLGGAAPDLSDAITGVNFTSQAVTPMTATTSRYFFSWGPHIKHGDAKMRDGMMQIAGLAFNEDKLMIEAQQRVLDAAGHPAPMPIEADKGVVLFNRLVNKLSRDEVLEPA